ISFYAAALDTRIAAALVSGYFDSRERVWEEPIYRNVFGLLKEFGDAEIASLIAPRSLVVEHSAGRKVEGPPAPRQGRAGAAPGILPPADYASVEFEFERARALLKAGDPKLFDRFKLISGTEGMATGPGSDRALIALFEAIGVTVKDLRQPGKAPGEFRPGFDPGERQQRQVKELEDFTQKLCRESEEARAEFFWSKIKARTPEEWQAACAAFTKVFWEEVIGRFPASTQSSNP